jgi:hypothetical protein
LVYKLKHNTQHKHPHHDELSPPPAVGQVFFDLPNPAHEQRGKGLDKGVVEAI